MGKFVCGADVTFKGGSKFAIDPMGCFDKLEDAVRCNSELHTSFGFNIYEVEPVVTEGLRRSFGIRQGSACTGYKIVDKACVAYEHPAWPRSQNRGVKT